MHAVSQKLPLLYPGCASGSFIAAVASSICVHVALSMSVSCGKKWCVCCSLCDVCNGQSCVCGYSSRGLLQFRSGSGCVSLGGVWYLLWGVSCLFQALVCGNVCLCFCCCSMLSCVGLLNAEMCLQVCLCARFFLGSRVLTRSGERRWYNQMHQA